MDIFLNNVVESGRFVSFNGPLIDDARVPGQYRSSRSKMQAAGLQNARSLPNCQQSNISVNIQETAAPSLVSNISTVSGTPSP